VGFRKKATKKKSSSGDNEAPLGSAFPIVGIGGSAGGLEAFEKFFSRLVSTGIAVMFLDRELRVRMVTPITAKLLSFISADIDRPLSDFARRVGDENLVADSHRVLEGLEPVGREILSDSNERYLRRIAPCRSSDNRIEGVVVIYVDITDVTPQKRDERSLRKINARLEARVSEHSHEAHEKSERLRAIVDTAAEAIITINRQGVIDSFNPAAERMFGYSKTEAIGQNVSLLMPSPYREEHDGYIARYLATGESRIIGVGREVEGRRKDGSTMPLDLSVSEVDHLGLFTGILRDFSERKRAEEAIADSKNRLRALTAKLLTVQEEERRQVSRELHDVIGQKLTLLRMQIDRMAATDTPLSSDDGSAARLRETIDALAGHVRDLSHQLHPSAVEHLGLVVALRKECDTVAKASGWEVHFRAQDDVPRRPPLAAAMCLYRVAQEAIQNALKHSGGGGIEVSIEKVAGGIQLSVVDFGHGFEADSQRSGWGLGLVTMEERARVVAGELEVTSVSGDGTRVRCWVPLPPEDAVE
jgi:PAS domain S-box-containing protein